MSISDSRTESDDASGDLLAGLLLEAGWEVVGKLIVSDDMDEISAALSAAADGGEINLLVTTGGTGLGPRDNTPEATMNVIERTVPGIAEAMRSESLKSTPMAMLSRGVCGVRNRTLIINFPGSPRAVNECFSIAQPVIQHAVNLISGKTRH